MRDYVLARISVAAESSLIDEWERDHCITDLYMPRMDGLELIRSVRADRSGLRAIIAVTGRGHLGWEATSIAASLGARSVLIKPFSVHHLLDAITQASQDPDSGAS
jgi:CheY-like chemotaxis protein